MSDDRYREWTAAYVLGALEPDERAELEAHLSECAGCRSEVAQLAPIPGLLARTEPPGDVPALDGALALALEGVAVQRRRLDRGRRRWRRTAVASVAAAAVLAVALAWPASEGEPDPERIALAVSSASASAEIGLEAREWGSVVDIEVLDAGDVPAEATYTAWVVGDDGNWEPACTWGVADDGWAGVQGASSIPVDEVAAVVITPAGDRDRTWIRAVPPG